MKQGGFGRFNNKFGGTMKHATSTAPSRCGTVRLIVALLSSAGLIGCTPMVKYHSETDAWQAGTVKPLESGQILFALPLTRLTLDVDESVSQKADEVAAAKARKDACALDYLSCMSEVHVRASSYIPDDAPIWRLSPTTFYLFYGKTALSATPSEIDGRFPKTVLVYYENTGKNAVVAGGAAFVAIYSFGLIPAIGAAAVAAVGTAANYKAYAGTLNNNRLHRLPLSESSLCDNSEREAYRDWRTGKDKVDDPKMPPNNAVIDLAPGSLQSSDGTGECWHPLYAPTPNWKTDVGKPPTFTGWVYRVVREAKPHGFATVPRASFVADKESKGSLPAPVCVRTRLQMRWWNSFTLTDTDGFSTSPALAITVADPDVVQEITIPKDGSINFDAVCGAYASLKSVPTTSADSMSALIKAVGDFRGETQKKK